MSSLLAMEGFGMWLLGLLIIVPLATNQAVLVYSKSSLFSSVRVRVDDSEGFIASILRCSFCLSHWVATAAVLSFVLGSLFWFLWILKFLLYVLAATRVSNIVHDLMRPLDRTPDSRKIEIGD